MKKNSLQHSIKRKWFILVGQQQEGPFNAHDLKCDKRVTPDTLVWKKGFREWKPARLVPELREVFEDASDPPRDQDQETKNEGDANSVGPRQAILILQQDPYQWPLWVLLAFLIFLYILHQVYDT